MIHYKVQLQNGADGTISEQDIYVRWDPEKVPADEVARACAAQYTVAGGKNPGGGFRFPFAGLTAILQEA